MNHLSNKTKPGYGKGFVELEDEIQKDDIFEAIKRAVRDLIAANTFDLPMLPHIATQVLKMSSNPNITFQHLEDLIKQDQMIAARLLKVANSPFYRGIDTIVSIKQALNRIGMKQLRDLVFSISVKSKIFRANKEYEKLMTNLWQHSVGAAIACQTVSKLLRIDSEYAFLAGLLHDIGKPVLLNVFLDQVKAGKMDEAESKPFLNDIFKEFHTQVGALAASRWALPKLVAETIRFHHEPEGAKEAAQMTRVAHVGNLLCHKNGIGCEAESIDLTQQKVMYELMFSPDQIPKLEEEFLKAYEALKADL